MVNLWFIRFVKFNSLGELGLISRARHLKKSILEIRVFKSKKIDPTAMHPRLMPPQENVCLSRQRRFVRAE